MGQPGAEAGCKQARGVDFLFISNELQFGSRVALKRVWEKRPFRMQTRLATTQPNLLPLREGFGTVDSIACFRQMDRCDQPQFLLEEIARVLRSGGLLLLFVLKTGRAALRTVALLQLPKPKRYWVVDLRWGCSRRYTRKIKARGCSLRAITDRRNTEQRCSTQRGIRVGIRVGASDESGVGVRDRC